MKFKSISSNFCVFFNKSKQIAFALYIDDLLIFFRSIESISKIKKQLFEKFNMKNMNKTIFISNIRIKQNKIKKFLIIDQIIYIKIFFKKYKMKKIYSITIFINGHHALTSIEKNKIFIDQKNIKNELRI